MVKHMHGARPCGAQLQGMSVMQGMWPCVLLQLCLSAGNARLEPAATQKQTRHCLERVTPLALR